MRISLNMIKDRLEPIWYTDFFALNGMEKEVKKVRLWDAGLQSFDQDTLFICGEEQTESVRKSADNYIAAQGSAAELLNRVLHILFSYQDWDNRLQEAVFQSEPDWHQVLSVSHEMIGLPLMLKDISYKTIAYTVNDTVDELAWYESQEYGYAGYFSETGNEAQRLIASLLSAKDVDLVAQKADILKHPYYPCKIIYHGNLLGLLIAVEVREIRPSCLELMRHVARTIAPALHQKMSADGSGAFVHATLLADLLKNRISTREELSARLKTINWRVKSYFFVAALIHKEYAMPEAVLTAICNKLARISEARALPFSGHIVIVSSGDSQEFLTAGNAKYLTNILREYGLVCGVSECFHNLLDLPSMYQQALDSANYDGAKAGSILLFDDYRLKILLSSWSDKANIKQYLHPAIWRLQEYDAENNAELLKTLDCYLRYCQNQSLSAKKLNIHRTTMVYRLERIKQLTGADFSDSETAFHLQLSFMLLAYGYGRK